MVVNNKSSGNHDDANYNCRRQRPRPFHAPSLQPWPQVVVILVVLAATLLLQHPVQGLRQCLQPTRLLPDDDDDDDIIERRRREAITKESQLLSPTSCKVPQVPTQIWHQTPCHQRRKIIKRSTTPTTNNNNNNDKSDVTTTTTAAAAFPPPNNTCCTVKDVCTVLAHGLLADYGVLDAVFLPGGACQSDIYAGNFTRHDAIRVVPQNNGLVVLQLNGSDISDFLEDGVQMALASTTIVKKRGSSNGGFAQQINKTALHLFPKVAGVVSDVNQKAAFGSRVSAVEMLSPTCEWISIDPGGYYTILTTHDMIRAYPSLKRNAYDNSDDDSEAKIMNNDLELLFRGHGRRRNANHHWGLRDALILHANSACTIQDPYMRGRTCGNDQLQTEMQRQAQQQSTATTTTTQQQMCGRQHHASESIFPGAKNNKQAHTSAPSIGSRGGSSVGDASTDDNKIIKSMMMKRGGNNTRSADFPTIVVIKK